MDFDSFYKKLKATLEYQSALASVTRGAPVNATVMDAAKPFLLAGLCTDAAGVSMVLTTTTDSAKRLHEQISLWAGEHADVMLFPEPDGLPYERLTTDTVANLMRLRTLGAMASASRPRPLIVVASAHAAGQKRLNIEVFKKHIVTLDKGSKLSIENLMLRFEAMGYDNTSAVAVPGEVSRRGGIVDIFPPMSETPVRLDFFGDEIESIKTFAVATQRTINPINSVTITPVKEVFPPESALPDSVDADDMARTAEKNRMAQEILDQLEYDRCNDDTKGWYEEEVDSLVQGTYSEYKTYFLPIFHTGSLMDYIPKDGLLIVDQPSEMKGALDELEAKGEDVRTRQIEKKDLPPNFPKPYFTWDELHASIQRYTKRLTFEPWGFEGMDPTGKIAFPFRVAPSYGGRLKEMAHEIISLADKQALAIASHQSQRLTEVLKEHGVTSIKPYVDDDARAGMISVIPGSFDQGWTLVDSVTPSESPPQSRGEAVPLVLLTDAEVFGLSKKRRTIVKRPYRGGEFLSQLRPGDYVVHVDHGIAKFTGVERRQAEGVDREYLILEYAGGDKLYVPVNQVDRVGPFTGAGDHAPSLSKLGTQEWTRTKERVKESAREMAQELLNVYASREVDEGIAFGPDTVWQQELENAFPYVETTDQLIAIADVKNDLQRTKPMDRLICGDVGFGKTEVALRAAFKAVMEGMQVAILVPTTILAQQHYQTFTERMRGFPVRIEALSRFRSDKEQKQIVTSLAEGKIDIVIGTHRLLQKDVSFKNLGLVVIDEEQRFGVAHKEKLKQMRKDVHALAMSATPIPRTLHMSLVGVRDMSTMNTPPEERLPINTYVGPYDPDVVRQAIVRELERGGQVFFVHNRVQNIHIIAERVRRLVPDARVVIGHGQMDEHQLENVMADFIENKADVLVCTTIIESGLDMPNVNTLIVNDANKYGLSQLYQLRGRVGRSSTRAYAYFLFGAGMTITETAEKRLKTMLTATELGAGFQIAIKDLEIRGAGNLLGPEQSGHISAVGFDLYCRLLADAVDELKAHREGKPLPKPRHVGGDGPQVDIPLPASIPEDYVQDVSLRLALYQRLLKATTLAEVDDFEGETKDRFGELPEETKDLLFILRVKLLAAEAAISGVVREGDNIVLRMSDRRAETLDRSALLRAFGNRIRLSPTQIRFDHQENGRWRNLLVSVLTEIGKMQRVAGK